MQNAPREHSAILSTCIKPPPVFKTFVLSIFEWSLKTGFTVNKLGSVLGMRGLVTYFVSYPIVGQQAPMTCQNHHSLHTQSSAVDEDTFFVANSCADPDEMLHYASFHHLLKYSIRKG